MPLTELQLTGVPVSARAVARWAAYAATAALLLPSPGAAQDLSQVRAASVACGSPALGGTTPFFGVVVNGECTDLSAIFQPAGPAGVWTGTLHGTVTDAQFGISATFDSDPFISFGATTTNLAAGPITYSFLFSVPIIPGFYNVATSTGGVTVTNGIRGTAVVATSAVYPTYISGYGLLGAAATNLGVDLGAANCTAGPGIPSTVTKVCNQGTTASAFAPGFYDGLAALLTYTQTDAASVASWSGAVTLNFNAVPEPATIVLVAAGLLATGGAALRRRQMR